MYAMNLSKFAIWTSSPVKLYDPDHDTNVWEISNGVDFEFPPLTSLPANGHVFSSLVLIRRRTRALLAQFRNTYGLSGAETIRRDHIDGKLNNQR